jgi:hypothetical protein|tara:strand:+ start:357 stop:557 length:201 start_codon:yes stop_codon:yes gene_type:complete
MFNNVGDPIDGFAVLECHPERGPVIVTTHQCLGNAEEERMVLNEMAEGTEFTFVVREVFGCMIETV